MAKTHSQKLSSSSKKLRTQSTFTTATGLRIVEKKVLTAPGVRDAIAQCNAARRRQLASAITPSAPDPQLEASYALDFAGLLDGSVPLDISHAGGEMEDIVDDFLHEEQARQVWPRQPQRRDHRTRRDRIERRNAAFGRQMAGMAAAYMQWHRAMGDGALSAQPAKPQEGLVEGGLKVQVIDVFATYSHAVVPPEEAANTPAVLVGLGLVPSAPLKPHVVFTVRLVELYRTSYLRCPHFAAEPFIKAICDLHRLPFRPYLAEQFRIAFDVYLAILAEVKARVDESLARNSPGWRLKNACAACTYRLEDEPDLHFKMLVTMDGNDSLKRLRCAETTQREEEEPSIGPSKSRMDSRVVHGDYYLTRQAVDRWAKAAQEEAEVDPELDAEESPCAERWTNMIHDATAKMWGVFDETGVFLALCRHSFVLVVADMVQSGELAKYPLAVVEALLHAFGDGIGGGYDIGCKFGGTVNRSELGEQARQLHFKALVGAFHGHAHNRICQLSNLATYVQGMGLEDLEGCERFFSKSNALASSTRYATAFHRQQKIAGYLAHMDAFETQRSLGNFLTNNYRQALDLLSGLPALQKAMEDQGIAGPEVFTEWLQEEKAYLQSLSKEPEEETLEMDYYQRLVSLRDFQSKLQDVRNTWQAYEPTTSQKQPRTQRKANPETRLRHALEDVERATEAVQELEVKMNIEQRWTPASPEWAQVALKVGRRQYRRCLDELERLVVSRIFELTKMNMSQTGYKQRKHIGKALKARSQAIRTALNRYNEAASRLSPPRPPLTWDEVVDYAFLADFDLLRDCRQNVSERPWARPAARALLDRHFRIERAREEVERLNVEIKRVVTHMRDEEEFLLAKEEGLATTHPELSYQVRLHREERTRYYDSHRRKFQQLARNPNFSGDLSPGKPLDKTLLEGTCSRMNVDGRHTPATPLRPEIAQDLDAEAEEGEDDSESITALAEALDVIAVTSGGQ
ncbi:hypothetical protein H0H92_014809 [Tricholoma furcatifolium]|nr:hypothetical protein H0H92_014809 [Tricholoma furcatifolium]